MKQRPSDPTRLVDLPPDRDLAKLAPLVRAGIQAPPEGSPLVRWRVRNTLRRQADSSRRALRVVLVGGVVFGAGGVVGAVVQPILIARVQSKAAPVLDAQPSSSRSRGVHGRGQPPRSTLAPVELESEPPRPSPASMTPVETAGPAGPLAPAPVSESSSRGSPARAMKMPPMATRLASSQPPVRRLSASSEGPRPPYVPTDLPSPLAPPTHAPTQPVFAAPPIGGAQVASLAPPSPSVPAASFKPPVGGEAALPSATVQPPPPAPPTPSGLPATKAPVVAPLDEQALLTKALHRLRITHTPESALAALDEHGARFPTGALTPEVARLRIEALLLLGRKDAALAELDRQSSDALPGSDERRVLRGELRATAGRWRAALADFDAILRGTAASEAGSGRAEPRSSDCFERALWGRASARSHLGDQAGARADLRDYLQRYPRGRFAPVAARLLGARR